MFVELSPAQFDRAVAPMTPLLDRTPVPAIIEGRTPGRIFVDDADQPRAAFIWNDFHYAYLAGDPHDAKVVEGLAALMKHKLIPEARSSADPTMVIYPHPTAWRQRRNMERIFPGLHITNAARKRFSFDSKRFTPADGPPDGLTLRSIDAAVLNNQPRLNFDVELFWTSREAFLREGFGYVVLDGERLASVCFAPCLGNGRAEVDIYTEPDYRRRGLARVAATAFIKHCLAAELIPVWECWDDNRASVKLAKSLGYRPLEDYPVMFISLRQWL